MLVCLSLSLKAQNDVRLLRQPDINGNQVVFVYAGDIWTVSAQGGEARRLTSHKGNELYPKISPDGKWIAFSAEYSGSRQIWVMPSEGGSAKQLTYYNSVGVMPPRGGFDNVVLDWTSDSKQILFRANRTTFGDRNGMYYLVSIDGGMETPLQIKNGGFAVLSPDDKKICFTPVDREFRSWKRYQGGRATELWIYDLEKNTSEQMTNFTGSDQWPTWYGDNIYYASDKDTKLNIYSYNTQTKQTNQLTFHKDFDVMWPSGNNGSLVYESGGYIYKLDLNSGKSTRLSVNLNYDNPNLVPYFKNVAGDVNSYNISPSGKRVLFDARGDIFSVPAKDGVIENLTQTSGIREIYPVWSPDGKYIAYYSDVTGEYEIYLLENKKGAVAKQITFGSTAWKDEAIWSPDSKYLLYSDRTLNLWLLDVTSGKQTIVAKSLFSQISSYDFSPDSKWITYSTQASNSNDIVMVYNIASGEATRITTIEYNSYQPVFSKDGKYIFFVSTRDFNMTMSSYEMDYVYNNGARLYAVALQNDGTKLVKEKNDVEPVKEEIEKPADNAKKSKSKESAEAVDPEPKIDVKIDFEGIENRVMVIPGGAGNYRIMGAVDGGILYSNQGRLIRYNIDKEENEDIMTGASSAAISADGKSFVFYSKGNFGVASIAPGQSADKGLLDLKKMEMKIVPTDEWRQIFYDAWRIFRDYFYVENMHGLDWPAVRDAYAQLLPSVGSRFDLDYLLGEMVSEVNVGHAYVNWGDIEWVDHRNSGLLGANIVADTQKGLYKITEIYPGENWNESLRSPLTEPGVDVKVGDYILSVDGHDIDINTNFYAYLENKTDVPVTLSVSATGKKSDARTYTIRPIDSELALLANKWVRERRAMVDSLSNGRIGYIYIPDTSQEGNRELFKGTYAYNDKEAMIYDDRYNGGGYIPSKMVEVIERRTIAYYYKNGLEPMRSPDIAHNGPKVMLINGYSSSGGDALPYYFRHQNQGKLIGTRTWGGLVGISSNATMVDGGSLSVPCFGIYDENGEWIIEGVGVYPDIEVVERPEDMVMGRDVVIERAVKELLKELDENPVKQVPTPVEPDRSKWIEKSIK